MSKSRILVTEDSFAIEFARCCREYDSLSIAVAWCGNPNRVLPYKHLEDFSGKIEAVVGISFTHTHPDAIEWFMNLGANIRVVRDDQNLFHPKIYLFGDQRRYALFVGSSNFTYGGFYSNTEANCLIEGSSSDENSRDIVSLEDTLSAWRSPKFSFKPEAQWLNGYRKLYATTAKKNRDQKLSTPPSDEEEFSTASWLRHADWGIFYEKVVAGEENSPNYHDALHVLDAASRDVPIPWATTYFKDIEKRRIIGGLVPYATLGHVAASGAVRHLLAKGTTHEWNKIVRAVNAIAALEPPIQWPQLMLHLNNLTSLGPTMRVWGRVLCIVRPDLYCTVSAVSVRKNLCDALGISKSGLYKPDGYIKVIQLIHSSPWFNSKEPDDEAKAEIWKNRVALLDSIFY